MQQHDYPVDGPMTGPLREAWQARRTKYGTLNLMLDNLFLLRTSGELADRTEYWKVSKRPSLEKLMRSFWDIPEPIIKRVCGRRRIELIRIASHEDESVTIFTDRSKQLYVAYNFNSPLVDRYGSRPCPITWDELVALDLLDLALTGVAEL